MAKAKTTEKSDANSKTAVLAAAAEKVRAAIQAKVNVLADSANALSTAQRAVGSSQVEVAKELRKHTSDIEVAREAMKLSLASFAEKKGELYAGQIRSKVIALFKGFGDTVKAEKMERAIKAGVHVDKVRGIATGSKTLNKAGEVIDVKNHKRGSGGSRINPVDTFGNKLADAFKGAQTAKLDDEQIIVCLVTACEAYGYENVAKLLS